jgi:DNA invertase Pin-like site-specific DNA recombinase
MIYGYCRVSTKDQKLERQIANIKKVYPDAKIYEEAFTGTKIQGRKELDKLLKIVKAGDTIVFDEVSRMSRNADEGFALYKELFQKRITLVFLKEPHISTETYTRALERRVSVQTSTGKESTDKLIQSVIRALNEFLMDLAKEQIKLAFTQAQKEVDYLHKRVAEGMKTSGAGEKISKARTGKIYATKKSKEAKEFIKKRNRGFGGDLTNEETWRLAGISKMTFYKYQKEIINESRQS